ncbi:MAG: glycosyltransferase [Methanobacteriaceae archaeon]|nr:glycosyltransferase [Methanobacteriaceae archaeon]
MFFKSSNTPKLYNPGKLNSKFSNIYLLLVGSAEKDCFEMYNLLVDKFNIGDKVFFKDFVKNRELVRYYNAADIGVWPGDHTITVNEAAGTALPIIIPDGVIAYNILKENNSALGFERGNSFFLSNQISNLIENQTIRKEMGNAAYLLIKNQLSWNKIAKDSIKIYNSC